ncbi:unnamed protein product [Symbiodinium sp. CCMP2592]|nr:unnamed protein product [Symbiodinium sp. CCMP2592]
MAAAGSAEEPAASGETALGALSCQKCGQSTTMSLSSATGRNPLLRACNGCLATDRWITRITTKPKNREETEDETQRRANGLRIKEDLKKKTPEEKKAFYVEQKVNRQAEDQKKKRTFSSAVGSVEESREAAALRDDVTNYITFKKWAAQEMALRIYSSLGEAKVAWEKLLQDPSTVSIMEHGEALVLDYSGIQVRGRQAHSLKSALRQRMDISEQKDLDEYMEESDSRIKRGRSRLAVEMTANSERRAHDLSQLREMEEARDADLQIQAIAIEEVQRQEKEERKRKAEAVEKSLPLEKLALQASRKKAIQTMGDVVLRNQATITALSAESQKLCEFENQDLKDEMKEKMSHVDRAIEVLSEEIAKYDSEWEKKEVEGTTTADEMAQLRGEIAVVLKGFHSNNEACKDVKNKIQDVRIWIAKTKKSINEREKAAAKTAAGKKMGKLAASMPLEALAEKLVKELTGESSFGTVDYSLNPKQLLEKLAPVLLGGRASARQWPASTTTDFSSREWVELLLRGEKAVAKRLKDQLNRQYPETGDSEGDAMTGFPPEMQDTFSLQFGQRLGGTASLWTRTDMNCPMLMVCLEGKLTVGGVPSKELQAATLADVPKKLEKMNAKDLAHLVKTKGWMVQMQAQGSILIPPDTCWFEVSSGETVHSLRMLVARESLAGPMKAFLEKMQSEGSIQDGDSYFKMLAGASMLDDPSIASAVAPMLDDRSIATAVPPMLDAQCTAEAAMLDREHRRSSPTDAGCTVHSRGIFESEC